MGHDMNSVRRLGRPRVVALAMVATVMAACAEDERVGPSTEVETVAAPDLALAGTHQGLVFSSSQLPISLISPTSVHTGMVYTATPSGVLSFLSQLQQKRGRVLIKLAGTETAYKNSNSTFNLTKWKAGVDRFRNINLKPYIDDGTIVGHYILDEPMFADRWGGQVIPQATVEEAAKHSKLRFPTLPTIVNAPPVWLGHPDVTFSYTGLDAGWAMYRSKNGNVTTWLQSQVNRAKLKKLGLVAGMNVLDGGNGSSGILGTQPRTYTMSAAELNSYGSLLLSNLSTAPGRYVCAFSMWRYGSTYYNRFDIAAAMKSLSDKAKAHVKTPCVQN